MIICPAFISHFRHLTDVTQVWKMSRVITISTVQLHTDRLPPPPPPPPPHPLPNMRAHTHTHTRAHTHRDVHLQTGMVAVLMPQSPLHECRTVFCGQKSFFTLVWKRWWKKHALCLGICSRLWSLMCKRMLAKKLSFYSRVWNRWVSEEERSCQEGKTI